MVSEIPIHMNLPYLWDNQRSKQMEAKPTHEELEQRVRELEQEALENKRIVDALKIDAARYR